MLRPGLIILTLLCLGCAEEPTEQVTTATPLAFPADFPYDGIAPPGATWFEVSGLEAGADYFVTLSIGTPGPNADITVASSFTAEPSAELCKGINDSSTVDNCSFTASSSTIYVLILNKGAVPSGRGFVDGDANFTLGLR